MTVVQDERWISAKDRPPEAGQPVELSRDQITVLDQVYWYPMNWNLDGLYWRPVE